jgi:hypothetical protein
MTRAALGRLAPLCRVQDYLHGALLAVIEPVGSLRPDLIDGVATTHWVGFASCDLLVDAVASGHLPRWADTVVYDCEAWPHTPGHEQANPIQQIRRAAAVAHSAGRRLVAAPSLGLARQLVPDAPSATAAYLSASFPESVAVWADGLHIQSQRLERQSGEFLEFVSTVTKRARAAAAEVSITAGLSTNPPGVPPTVQEILTCVRSTAAIVDGYWLNIPETGRWCPTCPSARPEVAAELLSLLTPR